MGISNDIAKLNAIHGLPQDNKKQTQAPKGDSKPNSVFGGGFKGNADYTGIDGKYTGHVDYSGSTEYSGKADYTAEYTAQGRADYTGVDGNYTGHVDYSGSTEYSGKAEYIAEYKK